MVTVYNRRRLHPDTAFWTGSSTRILTQRAAEQASPVVTQMVPKKAEELFSRVGNMDPSKSSLGRLPKALGDRWEEERLRQEQILREAIVVPEGTATLAVSLDGVLAPSDGGANPRVVRAEAAAQGRLSKGPAGYREIGCATLAFCDEQGDLVSAIRFGRAAESKQVTLKDTLAKDLAHIVAGHPQLRIAKISDAERRSRRRSGTSASTSIGCAMPSGAARAARSAAASSRPPARRWSRSD